MKSKIVALIATILEKKNVSINPIDIDDHFTLRRELGLDSLDLAELTVRIENEYGVDIFEDGIVETVGEILEKLERK